MIRRTPYQPWLSRLSAALISGAVLFSTGCSRRPQAIAPPDVHYGQTDCAGCGMTVSDERYAAALVTRTPDGEQVARVFDDIGCMVEYERGHPEVGVLAHYVKDYETHQWLPADRASYVRGDQIHSPMGFGLLAAESAERAEKVARAQSARTLDLPGLRAALQRTALQKPADSPVTDANAVHP